MAEPMFKAVHKVEPGYYGPATWDACWAWIEGAEDEYDVVPYVEPPVSFAPLGPGD